MAEADCLLKFRRRHGKVVKKKGRDYLSSHLRGHLADLGGKRGLFSPPACLIIL